jgi:hypothetical protein
MQRVKNPATRAGQVNADGREACRLAEPKQREETRGAWGSSIGGKSPMKRQTAKLVSVSNSRQEPNGAAKCIPSPTSKLPWKTSVPAWRSRAGRSTSNTP